MHKKSCENKIFIFYDPAYMLKLIRNAFQNREVLKNKSGELINWDYLVELINVQTTHKLQTANKLNSRHTHFFNEIMNVRLAA